MTWTNRLMSFWYKMVFFLWDPGTKTSLFTQNVSSRESEAIDNVKDYILRWLIFVFDGSETISGHCRNISAMRCFLLSIAVTYAEPCSAITTLRKLRFRLDDSWPRIITSRSNRTNHTLYPASINFLASVVPIGPAPAINTWKCVTSPVS